MGSARIDVILELIDATLAECAAGQPTVRDHPATAAPSRAEPDADAA